MAYPVPNVRCEDRSGYSCNKIVALDSPNCGDRAHFPGANGGAPIARRRGRIIPLTVAEDYDLIDDTPDLDPVTFDPRRIHVTHAAQEKFGRHPKVLQARIREAILQGGYWRTVTGGHLLEIGRHQMLLSSDGRRCESYDYLPEPSVVECTDPVDELVEPEWDREAVVLSPHVVRQFAGRHRVTEDQSEEELFGLLDDAAARGKGYRRDGHHYLLVDGFTVVLAPDGLTVISYRTIHAERTPSEVRNKVKSRFGHRHRRLEELGPEELAAWLAERDRAVSDIAPEHWATTSQIPELFDADRARITASVIEHGRTDRYAELQAIREDLRRAAHEGRWTSADEGRHVLEFRDRKWLISAHGRGVLSCNPPWPVLGEEAGMPLPDPDGRETSADDEVSSRAGRIDDCFSDLS